MYGMLGFFNAIGIFMNTMFDTLPQLCRVKDLIKVGIYRSPQAAYEARRMGVGPSFIRIPKTGILYPRDEVIRFLKSSGWTK